VIPLPEIRVSSLSDIGRREQNEDALLVDHIGQLRVFAVADGLGGHARGEVASAIAVDTVKDVMRGVVRHPNPEQLLKTIFERANAGIHAYNSMNRTNAGTTLTVALVDPAGACWIGNVGDSRAYVFFGGSIWHTRDHSYVQQLVDAGLLDPAGVMNHPEKNILTRALGLAGSVDVDVYERTVAGAMLVLSSDGLHDWIAGPRIQEIVTSAEPAEACERLASEAKAAGSTDNISVIVARL